MAVQLVRRLFTVDEYHRMAEVGIFKEDDRVELLDGEVVQMAPIGSKHAACVDRLNELLVRAVSRLAIIRTQSSIRLGTHSEPQPDLALLKRQANYYSPELPGPQDVLLVIEVADTSAGSDREVKIPLYARAGVLETWLVDLTAETVEVFRTPSPIGYKEIHRATRGDQITPQAVPDLVIAVDEVLV
jgi:Uma2 family endonuclease